VWEKKRRAIRNYVARLQHIDRTTTRECGQGGGGSGGG
jgi:hypothetical protein